MDFRKSHFSFLSAVALLLLTASFTPVFAQTAPTLGTAQNFAILGASAVTNTGPTIINGDLGVSPGTAVTGFGPGIVNGTIHAADAVAAQAGNDANTAYNSLAGQPCNTILTGQDLGGLTLTPGVYCYASSAQLTGTLTLNGQGNPNAVFIFKMGSTLTTASKSSVVLVNGSTACNVFFQVGSSATLGTGTQFIGNIFALASVTLTTNVNVFGRAVGLNGAVTLDSNVVSVPTCGVVTTTGFVQVCKVAGAGVAVGTNFAFNVAGTPVTVAAGAAPGGSCSTPLTVPAGPALITETIPTGIVLAGVSTLPSAGLLVSSNLAAGTATVTILAGGQTIVTFIDAIVIAPPTISKSFAAPKKVIPGGTIALSFTVGNPNSVAALPGVGFTDTLPAGLVVATPNGLSGSCGGGTITAAAGSNSISLANATLAASASCTFSVNVTAATDGIYVNTTGAVFSAYGSGGTATDTLFVAMPPRLSKSFGNVLTLLPGGTTGLAFSLTNPNSVVTLNGLAFSDTLPAGLLVSTPNGLVGSCDGGTITATAGTNLITLTGASLAPGASCAFTVNVTAANFELGLLTNTTSTVTSNEALPGVSAFANIFVGNPFQVRFASNLGVGDSVINITNSGTSSTNAFPTQNGNICLNVYTFSPDEQLISCCACPVTPDGLESLSARSDLISNTLTPGVPTSIVTKILASTNASCNASLVTGANLLATGLAAWGTTIHALPVAVGSPATTYGVTETPFTPATLSVAELTRITALCGFIQTNGSGFGICKSCRLGGLANTQ